MKYTVSLLATLSFLIASFAAGHAQGTDLTVDALQTAMYGPVNPQMFGDSVQLVDGGFGGISQRSYVFGDLNGDGADDAVVEVIELLGCCASSINVALAAYVNDLGVPNFAGTVPLGTASDVKSITVDSGVITVAGFKLGPNDPACCPKQPFELQLILQGNQLVEVSGATSAPTDHSNAAPSPSAPAPDVSTSTPDLSSVGSGFRGQMLIPPPGLQPFASLQLSFARPELPSYSTTGELVRQYPQSYSLGFSDPNPIGQFGVAGAEILGAGSRQMYDDTAAESLKTFTGCAATAAYCARRFPPCTGIPCPVEAELFRGLTVRGSNALVRHVRSSPPSWDWSVTWFDSQAGVSYSLLTANGANPGGFDKSLSANNKAGAEQLAALAEKLVRWTGS